MNDEDREKSSQPPAGESQAQDALRRLSAPLPDPAFRDRLRRDFASGAIESPWARRWPAPLLRRRPLAVGLAAAIAVFVIGMGAARLNRGPRWTLQGTSGSGTVLLDGQAVSLGELAKRIGPGRRIELRGDIQLDLLSRGVFAFQATAGSSLTLPAAPGRWWGRAVTADVRAGEVRVVAGARFRGAHLTITAPEAEITATGTTFAVICEPGATCLCVLEGSLTMTSRDGHAERVAAGMRRTVYRSGAPPLVEAIRPMERMKLGMLAEQSRPLLDGH